MAIHDLDMENWKIYDDLITDSLWLLKSRAKRKISTGNFHGNWVPQIPEQILHRFTKKGDTIIDLFNGAGTTLFECLRLGRNGIGVDLNTTLNEQVRKALQQYPNTHEVTVEVIDGDSMSTETFNEIQNKLPNGLAQHVFLHPPYWDIIQFSEDSNCLSNATDVADFRNKFRTIAYHAKNLLSPGRHMTLVIGDKYAAGEWTPLGFETIDLCRKLGFKLKSICVKDVQGNEKGKGKDSNLWRYRALKHGFYVFKHEYIAILQKPK